MLFDKYKNKMDKYLLENITFRTVTLILSLLIVFLIWIIVSRTDSQKVVFMPPKIINQEFWIAGNEVSKTYLHEMGQFVSFNLLNITKENANNNIENLLTLVDSKFYNEVKIKLLEQSNYITDNAISRTFFVSAIDADTKGLIKVFGVVKDIIGDKVVRSSQSIVNIHYEINQGRFVLNDILIEEGKNDKTKDKK
ncbi:TraE/TraK family type IV conjugative transfer system protein [Campylobacter helveticus]|uniref:TraE/TraK family type IV conjugative transfer system protein n=1 Tax=Campylobacter helveticus TaxID=28898 RepID=UPI0009C1E0D1|nr:TraE/TraK family type IV conjugative transfer system protein [Campylobacter helveticus]ARE80668.1 conjugative transfer system protein TraE [Campylobacter helveticus]MCR2059781.1 type IV conjugative transfer system protein TraE [Campylobacter helveticus]MCR2061708.1 type IV conjugative transfer system protein TraE [Campylobacter helveticus]TNH34786.1 conjugal transfer protein TraE [Campylobacter helveticus]TXK51628.1 conjugal transfer protein TraE [Campylobacter helveticus]